MYDTRLKGDGIARVCVGTDVGQLPYDVHRNQHDSLGRRRVLLRYTSNEFRRLPQEYGQSSATAALAPRSALVSRPAIAKWLRAGEVWHRPGRDS